MNLPKFLYYILTKDGRSAKVVNKTVTFVGEATHLPQTPDGWQDILMAFEKSIETHGLSGNFTLNLGYVLDACRVCSDTVYKFGTEKELYLLINQLTLLITNNIPIPSYKWVYKYFTKQEINFAKCEDERDMFKSPLIPGGIDKLIKSAWDTKVQLPMNVIEVVNLYHNGISLVERANYVLTSSYIINYTDWGLHFALPLSFVNKEGRSLGLTFETQGIEEINGVTSWSDRLLFPNKVAVAGLTNLTTVTAKARGKLYLTCRVNTGGLSFKIRFVRSNQSIGVPDDYIVWNSSLVGGFVAGVTYPIDVNVDIPLQPGERLYLDGILFGGGGVDQSLNFELESKMYIEFENRAPATTIKCFTRRYVFDQLVKKATGKVDNTISDLCDEFDADLLTCGDAIRGLENPVFETSLADFFKDNDSSYMAGFDIFLNKARLESRELYYPSDDSDEVDLGDVTDFSRKPAEDKKYNTFKFGNPKQDIEDTNGKFDPNGTNLFTGPLTKDVKEYTQVSNYKNGPLEIELLRTGLDGKSTTDNNSDKSIFVLVAKLMQSTWTEVTISFIATNSLMIVPNSITLRVGQQIRITGSASNDGVYDIVGVAIGFFFQFIAVAQTLVDETDVIVQIEIIYGAYYELDREVYDTLEGVPNDTIYNLKHQTPKRKLKRHARWIAGSNHTLLDKPLKFSNGNDNNNTALKTIIGSAVVDEDGDEYVSDPLYLPWYFIFKTIVRVNIPTLLEENPNRRFRFRDENGNYFKGFLQMGGIAVNTYTPQEFRLLAAPDNDLTLLIHG